MDRWATEEEAIEELGIDMTGIDHCSSCHYDATEGWSPMLEVVLPDGRYADVCCTVANAPRKYND